MNINFRWWDLEGEELLRNLNGALSNVLEANNYQRQMDLLHAAMYGGASAVYAIGGVAGFSTDTMLSYLPENTATNLVRSQVDAVVAKLSTQRPLPQALPNHGKWSDRRKAQKMSQLIEGAFAHLRIFEKFASLIRRDACIFGRGYLQVSVKEEQLYVERILPWQVHYDLQDARFGMPTCLYKTGEVDAQKLVEEFAADDDAKAAMIAASVGNRLFPQDWRIVTASTTDKVEVAEAWRLPLSKDKPGKHVIWCQGTILFEEEWSHTDFPFAVLNYSDPLTGVIGSGLAEQLEGIQYALNSLEEKITQATNLSGSGVILSDGSGIVESEINNDIGVILHTSPGSAPPQVFQNNLLNPVWIQRSQDLRARAFQDTGVSQLAASALKPAGVTSAVAIQAVDDIESERFAVFGRKNEAWALDVARLLIVGVQYISEHFGDYKIQVQVKNALVDLKWKDCKVNDFQLRVFPTSLLPQQLGARLQKLEMLMNLGIIDKKTFLRQLDAPDLGSETDIETADQELVDAILESYLDATDKNYEELRKEPSPTMDLKWAFKRTQNRLNSLLLDGAPDVVQELYRKFMDDCMNLMTPPPPPPPMAPEMPMPAIGEPPMPAPPEMPLPPPVG